jgi:hypothetical protein
MKDLENDYQQIGDQLSRVDCTKVPEKHLLQQGDVLFIAKGANNYALVFDKDIKAAVFGLKKLGVDLLL